jgi:hypothetical protein
METTSYMLCHRESCASGRCAGDLKICEGRPKQPPYPFCCHPEKCIPTGRCERRVGGELALLRGLAMTDANAIGRELVRRAETAERSISDAAQAWVPVSERMPESGKYVLAFGHYENGNTRRIRAKWCAKHTEESTGDWDEFGDYDEEQDTYYTPEGWYECNEFEETNWKVEFTVTHWMPLPPEPTT